MARGYFSLIQFNYIESVGPVTWDIAVNPLWDKIIQAVDFLWTDTNLHPSRLTDLAPGISSTEAQQFQEGCEGVELSPSGADPMVVARSIPELIFRLPSVIAYLPRLGGEYVA